MSVARIRERVPQQERGALEMSVRYNSDSAAYRPRQSLAGSAVGSTSEVPRPDFESLSFENVSRGGQIRRSDNPPTHDVPRDEG
jgi:hypothetical protein